MTIADNPTTRPSRRPVTWPWLWAGLFVGLGAIAVPAGLLLTYEISFTHTATPDSAFNIFTVGAMLGLIGAATGATLALVALRFPASRPLGAGYFIGAGVGVICSVIAFATFAAAPLS